MSNCTQTVYSLIETYLNMGWIQLATIFTKNMTAKEKDLVPGVNAELLVMLGGIRKYLVNHIYTCCTRDYSEIKYFAFGSDNITSDYDLTLVGKKSPTVVWKMFTMFLKQYNNILPYAFDTNLYCSGIYSPEKALNIPHREDIDENIFVLTSKTKADITVQMEFALLKLMESGFTNYEWAPFKKYEAGVLRHKKIVDRIFKEKKRMHKKKYEKVYTDDTIDKITEYYLTVLYAKKINKILYETGHTDDLFLYACISQYFAIESYYTPATVNVIVMNIQGKQKVPIQNDEYIIATLENLADFRMHLTHEQTFNASVLLKYSKYVYRILYCLGKATRRRVLQQHASQIKKDILPLRKTGNTEGLNAALLMYTSSMKVEKYIQKVTDFVCSELERK